MLTKSHGGGNRVLYVFACVRIRHQGGVTDTTGHSLETNEGAARRASLTVPDNAVREQVERILGSPHFRTSKRCQALLRYVVEAYTENHSDRVKERIIGFEVFQREADYDTNQDSVVRTTAAEIRKKLAQYYQEPGHENEIRVGVAAGLSTCRSFACRQPWPAAPTAPVPPGASAPAALSAMRQRFIGMAIALAVMAAAGLGIYVYSRGRVTELNLFWRPLLEDGSSAVICVGRPPRIYIFEGHRSAELNEKMVCILTTPPASPRFVEYAADAFRVEVRGVADHSVGDYLASVRLAEFLGHHGKPFEVIGDRERGVQGSARTARGADRSIQ